jgi:hypothetical protein
VRKRELSLWDVFDEPRSGARGLPQMLPSPPVAPQITELAGVALCRCAARGGSASGFRLDERQYWVHAPCGRPTQGWLVGSGTVAALAPLGADQRRYWV